MTLRQLSLAILFGTLLVLGARAQGTPALRHGIAFGTFSNLRYVDESGDVLGTEITIVPQYRSAYAIFQCAEGAPTNPIFVPVAIKRNRVTFTIKNGDGCPGTYNGIVNAKGLTLSVNPTSIEGDGFLPRRKSYWAR
jgi:hypothetical protein